MTQGERMSWFRAGSLLVLTFTVCAAGPNLGARQERQYTNQDQGWSIAFPRDWRLDDRTEGYVKITSPGDPAGIVGIHATLFDRDRVNVDDFATAGMAAESRRPGFKILSRQPIARVDATSALEIVNVLGVKPAGKSRKVFVIAGHRGFVVNAETYLDAWPSFEAAFDRIVSSFKVAPLTWQSRMQDARQLAEDGVAYSITTATGVAVFHNNARPVCYTYTIPGDWVAAPEPSAYNSPDGKAFVGFLAMRDEDLREYPGRTPAERSLNGITRRYEANLGQKLNVQTVPLTGSRVAWKWTAAPVVQRDREMTLPAKFVIELDRGAVAALTIGGTADDDGLARRIIESLKTTTARSCYWPDLERLLKGGDGPHAPGDSARRPVR
jgi:photosystem II reaction center protein PsbP